MPFVAFCCSFCVLVRVSICHSLPFAALRCSFLFLNHLYLKNQNRQMLFIARYGFLLLVLVFCRCFNLSIALLVVDFCWYEKPKRATKGKKCPNGNKGQLTLDFFLIVSHGGGGGGGHDDHFTDLAEIWYLEVFGGACSRYQVKIKIYF